VLVTPYFVFVHVRKTGGITIDEACRAHFPVLHWTPERHEPYSDVPREYADLPAVSFVRNPWDWYVSTWAWMVEHGGGTPMAKAARAGFDDFIRLAYQRAAAGRGMAQMFEEVSRGTDVEKFEGLADNFIAFLRRHSIPVPSGLSRDLKTIRLNESERGPYETYYDEVTREMVAEATASIIERFGYRF
jgi:hypothetical protein